MLVFEIKVSGDGSKRQLSEALIQLATEIDCMVDDDLEIENSIISANISIKED